MVPHEPGSWAWSTLLVNALGAAVLCALLAGLPSPQVRLLVGTGLLGSFTTFSAFSLDAVLLADGGRPGAAAAYLLAGVFTLVLGGLIGLALGRAVRS